MNIFPPESGSRQIHPRMQAHLRSLKMAQAVIFGAMFIMIGLMAAFTMLQPAGAGMIRPMLPAMGLVILVFIILARVLRNTMAKKALAANDLMLRSTPRTMQLRPTGVNSMQGILVELHEQGAGEYAPPFGLAVLQTSRRTPVPRKPMEVEVYLEQYGHPHTVVVDTGKYLYWGRLTEHEDRVKMWGALRWMLVSVFGILALLVLVLVFLQYTLLTYAEEERQLAVDSAAWPVAQGTVLDSRVAETTISKGKSRVRAFEAVVEYEYSVDGENFSKNLVHFCYSPHQTRRYAEEIVARYPQGAAVTVRHHPAGPGLAVLEAGRTDACDAEIKNIKQTMLMAGAMASGVFLMLFVIFRMQNNKRKQLAARLERNGIRL
jgi:hypothetical protein